MDSDEYKQNNAAAEAEYTTLESEDFNLLRSSSDSHDYSDLDRKMPAKPERSDSNQKLRSKSKTNKDNRFVCSICLETVSDEPVVTRCGHLYCWSCLYQWLEPGMLLSEYTAAFGSPPGVAGVQNSTRNRNDAGGRAGLNFLNEMTYRNVNANHRPYNPSGGSYNEARRCCPVCKADCTVDSVIPVYIQHSVEDGSIGLDTDDEGSDASISLNGVAAMTRGPTSSPVANTSTPNRSPTLETMSTSFDTDPTSNVGMRQRRRASPRNHPMFDSPMTERTFAGGSAPIVNGSSLNDTPVHRNRSQNDDREERHGVTTSSHDNVPSRPVPTSPWVTNRTLHPTTSTPPATVTATQQFNNEANEPVIGTSSPFRLALRPRRQPFLASSPPRAYHSNTQHHGGLTSVLMGIVDTIDNLASQGTDRTDSNPVVPQLHRSDGGMGGIGRASEQPSQEADAPHLRSEEESSLEMAREFLSRLLLMLACFVVLCLLLF